MDALSGSLSLRSYGASPGSHSHAHFQILLGLSGALELEIEGRGLRVGPGGGCVIAPGDRHDFASARGSLCLVLDSSHPDWARSIISTGAVQEGGWFQTHIITAHVAVGSLLLATSLALALYAQRLLTRRGLAPFAESAEQKVPVPFRSCRQGAAL